MPDLQPLAQLSRGKTSIIIIIVALLPLVLFALIVKEFPVLNNTLIKYYLGRETKSVTFHSGTEGGLYHKIGQALKDQQINCNTNELNIEIKTSRGSRENMLLVSRLPNSFGIVQADALIQTDIEFGNISKENIQPVTPLYLEMMHLIMRKADVDEFKKSATYGKKLSDIAVSQQDFLRAILENRKISTGPFQGGTNAYASAILNAEAVETQQNLYNLELKEGLDYLAQKRIDALFFMSGVPAPKIKAAIEGNKKEAALTLIPVTGSFPVTLQRDLKLPVNRSIIEKKKYSLEYDVSTIGIPAWLIASKNISTNTILKFLYRLQRVELHNEEYKKNIDNAISRYESIKEAEAEGAWGRLIIFLSTFFMSWLAFSMLFITLWSKLKQSKRYSKIHKIYLDSVGFHTKIEKDSAGLLSCPMSEKEGTSQLNKLIDGISKLNALVKEIREDYKDGSLLIMDVKFLLDRLYGVLEILHRQVTQYMFLLISSKKEIPDDLNDLIALLRKHYIASCITKDDYEWLTEYATPKEKGS